MTFCANDQSVLYLQTPQVWERDFQQNHAVFEKHVASNIASDVLRKFGEEISNPCPIKLQGEIKISFEITKQSAAQILQRYSRGNTLPPFAEWLSKLSERQAPLNASHVERIEKLMAKAGIGIKDELNKIFTGQDSLGSRLHCRAKWYNLDSALFSPADFTYRFLKINYQTIYTRAIYIAPSAAQSIQRAREDKNKTPHLITVAMIICAWFLLDRLFSASKNGLE